MPTNPTDSLYALLNQAYGHFNRRLFGSTLPDCVLTLQRHRNTMGYFSAERWADGRGALRHEIALNPAYFARNKVVEMLQTLVHEQVHLWQHLHGRRRSRSGYHNREWAEKMRCIGLMPSSTGEVGGRETGQTMSDYPLAGGPFIAAAVALVEDGFEFDWIDTEPAVEDACQWRDSEAQLEYHAEIPESAAVLLAPIPSPLAEKQVQWETDAATSKRLSKSKYQCPQCLVAVWGKPGLNIACGDCSARFVCCET